MLYIPEKCKFIFEKLHSHGFECFAVGGCVRDSLMGNVPSDWDFTTNAQPDDIISCFSDFTVVDIGKRFGTICVVIGGEPFEITTYRSDGEYSDSRHPDKVTFSTTVEDDLARRDFTVNSIAYSPEQGILDPYMGVADINAKVIRCTGEPKLRFTEDALRMLRALRFSSKLGFSLDAETAKAIHNCRERLSMVHPQRMRKELTGLLLGDNVADVLSKYSDVISVIIPEIAPMFGVAQQNPHHIYDVWEHTVCAVSNVPSDEMLRLAAFFHDTGKPHTKTTDSKGIDHFKKHQIVSENIARGVLRRFSYPKETVDTVCKLVRFHDERFRNMSPDIKRVLGKIGEELFFKLLILSRADMMAQSDYLRNEKFSHLDEVEHTAREIISRGECYKLSQLALNGNDLRNLGFEGEAVGRALGILLNAVIKGKVENTKEQLLLLLKSISKV